MNRLSKSLCFVLILCMLGSMLPFALADGAEAEAAEEAIVRSHSGGRCSIDRGNGRRSRGDGRCSTGGGSRGNNS